MVQTHVVGVLLTVKGKCKGQDIVVAMIWTSIVEHTLRGNPVPVKYIIAPYPKLLCNYNFF